MPYKILIIDDDPDMIISLKSLLKVHNYETESTTTTAKALKELHKFKPDVILVDWQMPEMSGLEFVHMVKQDPAYRHYYVIMVSGRTGTEDIVKGLDAGADDYLIKPFQNAELLARVRSGLRVRNLENRIVEETKKYTVLEMALSVADKIGNPIAAAKIYTEVLVKDPLVLANPALKKSLEELYSLLLEALELMNKYQQITTPQSIPAPSGKTMINPQ